ncbi:MAG: branched-chain amino acid ABC transporter permease [Lachnospiraceae bacterium]|jgi:branched-chain amino acid transport system permease protein|nr:branched-chain amino acid ABC transporter permease [Lachnospiraceae bacterium]
MKIQKVKKRILPLLLIAALYGIPLFVKNQYMLRIGVYVCIYSILACSLNLISGVCGQVSMGHAAFYGIGAYASALAAIHFGINWVVCVIAAAMAAGVIGALIGIPALKLSGGYLVICTVGFGELVRLILLNWVSLTRGPMGLVNIPRPVLFGVTIKSGSQYMVVALTLFLLIYLILHNILNSKYGRNLKAIREDEIAAETMGIHVHREKVIAFATAAAMAGAAGSLLAHYMLFISPTIFVGDFSTNILSMVVLGGMGFMPGSVIAATLLTVIPETLRGLDKYRMLIYGFLLIGLMLGKNVSWETTALGRWGTGVWGKIRQRKGLKEGDGKG